MTSSHALPEYQYWILFHSLPPVPFLLLSLPAVWGLLSPAVLLDFTGLLLPAVPLVLPVPALAPV